MRRGWRRQQPRRAVQVNGRMKAENREDLRQPLPRKSAERHAILRIRSGPLCDTRMLLRSGQPLLVGRSASAGFTVPHDELMAGSHFELSWDGQRATMRNLCSAGTLMDGERVDRAAVSDGSWMRAGQTDFTLFFEGQVPPLPTSRTEAPDLVVRKAEALELLQKQELPLYAILDAARSERILLLLHHSVEEYRSLYEGPRGDTLWRVAPYLVSLTSKNSWLLGRLVEEGWGASWGTYLVCSQPLRELRRHLRKFLLIEAEGHKAPLFFRFYDPRVLRTSLPALTRVQRKEFFGPIWRFLFEGPGAEALSERPQ